MVYSSPFQEAHYKKIRLSKQTMNKIIKIYKRAGNTITEKLDSIMALSVSDETKQALLVYSADEFDKVMREVTEEENEVIRNAAVTSGMLAIWAGNKFMKKAGLRTPNLYTSVPSKIVDDMFSGKGYPWKLSDSIWHTGTKARNDIDRIIRQGIKNGTPVQNIAKDLQKYVKPSALKPVSWARTYPNVAGEIDYNAQRLARTAIQHAHQLSLQEQQRNNPFCIGIRWYSEGIHGKNCEECIERSETDQYGLGEGVFPVDELPLDHPNGLCWFEPVYADEMNETIKDFEEGEDDPDLEEYIENGLN